MRTNYALLLAVMSLASLFLKASGQTACQSAFLTKLNQCLGNVNLTTDNFLYVARDGKLGKVPDNPVAFQTRLCSVRVSLTSCVREGVDSIQLLPEAQCNSTQKAGIVTLFKGFFKTVNKKCENPCRSTFKQSLTKCYTDLNFKLPDYLIFSPTAPRDFILGTNLTEVQHLCNNQTVIMECMKNVLTTCEDWPHLLDSYSLDLDSLNEAYTTLCNYSKVYIEAVKCYEVPISPVVACRGALSTRISSIESQFEDLNLTVTQYRDEICRSRLTQFQCEIDAVKPGNDTDKCNSVVVGLRKQQECQLLPKTCRAAGQSQLSSLCRETDFKIPERVAFAQALTSSAHVTRTAVVLVMSTVMTTLLLAWV